MKKTALLLIISILLSLAAGCVGDDVSGSVSETVSDISTDVSEAVNNPTDDAEYATAISIGCKYTCSANADDAYPDSYGTELTDGQAAAEDRGDYTAAEYSGYSLGSESVLDVVVDLGDVYDTVYGFRCGYLATTNAGIYPPAAISVAVSVDGTNYNSVGTLVKPEYEEDTRQEASLISGTFLSARYVKFSVTKAAAWIFIDELTVIADEKSDNVDNAYLEMVSGAYSSLGTVSFTGGNAPDRSLSLQLISENCKYTSTGEQSSVFSDDGDNLTDGTVTGYYESGNWVGFNGGEAVDIIVDLGTVRSDIAVLKLFSYANTAIGMYMPAAVTYSVSNDGKTFTDIGRVFGPTSAQNTCDFTLSLPACASGRYIRFRLEATDTTVYLVEEAAVYAYTDEVSVDSCYPPLSFDGEIKNWKNPSSKMKNLILGLTQQINSPVQLEENTWKNNTPVTSKLMTDGKRATVNSIHNGQFFKFNTGSSRDIIYDLGATSAVSSFFAEFTHLTDWAVVAPGKVSVYLSINGADWYSAGAITIDPATDNEIVSGTLTLSHAVQARYVCFSFIVSTWAGISELEVMGTESTAGAYTLENSGFDKRELFVYSRAESSADILGGTEDLCLLYHSTSFGYTVEQLIPYLAYVDTDGKITDTMFDSFLFLLSGKMPSGLSPWEDSTMTDLKWTVTDLFTEGENILALEEAAGQVKKALGLGNDYKYKFTVTLYYPNSSRLAFGDIDGDGESEDLTDYENRLQALIWYMQFFEDTLAKYDFKNIEFVGYYWYCESVYTGDDAYSLVTDLSHKVHERGYDFFWIPYYCAAGFTSWDALGFDIACMQPNYVFDATVPYSRLESAAQLTEMYGMGIEIEISEKSFTDATLYRKYLEYLGGGEIYGYMNDCVHMYYQDFLCYYKACNSTDVSLRLIYDYTYQFIKGTLNVYPDDADDLTFNCSSGTVLSAVLAENVPEYVEYSICVGPEHGTVTINEDGSFVYYPEEGYTGTVTFTYVYNECLCDSAPATVTLNIG